MNDQVGRPARHLREQVVHLRGSIHRAEPPRKGVGAAVGERDLLEPLAVGRVPPAELGVVEPRRQQVEAEGADALGKACCAREDDLIAALGERACERDERHKMAVGGAAGEEDAHEPTLARRWIW